MKKILSNMFFVGVFGYLALEFYFDLFSLRCPREFIEICGGMSPYIKLEIGLRLIPFVYLIFLVVYEIYFFIKKKQNNKVTLFLVSLLILHVLLMLLLWSKVKNGSF
jgi:hypothetical protein